MTTQLLRELLALDADAHCATALVVYFSRHPHVYVTIDRLTAQVGYGADRVEACIDTLIRAGFIMQRRHAGLNAVMYRVSGPLWPPRLPGTQFMSRWWRQMRLVRNAHERCRRSALRAARADERIRRTGEIIAARRTNTSLPRDE